MDIKIGKGGGYRGQQALYGKVPKKSSLTFRISFQSLYLYLIINFKNLEQE